MSAGVFLVQDDEDRLVEMSEQPYDSEDILQTLLAKYPNLLASDQMNDISPRRWLLVKREAEVPAEENGAARWFLDHLFLDQDGIPTLVEVKRSSDTRIRREVVGQMLDYAANAVAYWPVGEMRESFKAACLAEGKDPEDELRVLLQDDREPDELWTSVKTNLEAGRIRMVFVSDEIPTELQRVVEFLNSQMNPAEVFAVQIKQYAGEGMRTLVPRLIGQTASARDRKSASRRTRTWDEQSFFAELASRPDTSCVRVARRILEWATQRSVPLRWGKGVDDKDGAFHLMLDSTAPSNSTLHVRSSWVHPYVEIQFCNLRKSAPFEPESRREELRHRLNNIASDINIEHSSLDKRPGIRLSVLAEDSALRDFLAVLDWILTECKAV